MTSAARLYCQATVYFSERQTRPALVAAMVISMSLVLGSSLLKKWRLVSDQLPYGLSIRTLVLHLQRTCLCLDPVATA